jgi:hypothetical protein
MRKVLQLRKLCHCIIRWEKYHNSRPTRQGFNCQSFGHSSNFCGRPPKCVKCYKQHASKDCIKPASVPPKCTNCGGEHPANYTGCPQYLRQLNLIPQKNNQQHRATPNTKTNSHQFQYQQFPTLKTPQTNYNPSTNMGTNRNPDTSGPHSATHQFHIRIVKNHHKHVQPPTSVFTVVAFTGNQTPRNKRPYR